MLQVFTVTVVIIVFLNMVTLLCVHTRVHVRERAISTAYLFLF